MTDHTYAKLLRAQMWCARAQARAADGGHTMLHTLCLINRATVHLAMGDASDEAAHRRPDEAPPEAPRRAEAARRSIESWQQALAHAQAATKLGLLVEASEALDVAIELAAQRGDAMAEATLLRRQRRLLEDLHFAEEANRAQLAPVVLDTEHALREAAQTRTRVLALSAANAHLRQQAEELNTAALQDPLTGLANRGCFDHDFLERHARARRQGAVLAVAMLDIDHFKRVNDRHGHPAGDAVLRHLATVMLRQCRKGDLLARVGGEEFAIVWARMQLDQSTEACERLRAAVQAEDWSVLAPGTPITLSIGLADAAGHAVAADGLAQADARLYRAKQTGRNRVVAAADPESRPPA